MVAILTGVYAWLARPVLDGIFIEKNEQLLLVLPLAILAVAAVKALFSYGVGYLMAYVGNRVVADIRQELFQQLMRMPIGFHDSNTSGRLVSRIVNDVGLMANAASSVIKDMFQNALTFLAMVGVILYQVGGNLAGRDSACWADDGSSGEAVEEIGGEWTSPDGRYVFNTPRNVCWHQGREGLRS
jgi:ABC-type multidrug transport system fused ATPase/permease subunit